MWEQPDLVLAALLKRLREERGITQEQLAYDAGITSSALSRIERGINSPGWMTVKRITTALDVSLVALASDLEKAACVEQSIVSRARAAGETTNARRDRRSS